MLHMNILSASDGWMTLDKARIIFPIFSGREASEGFDEVRDGIGLATARASMVHGCCREVLTHHVLSLSGGDHVDELTR